MIVGRRQAEKMQFVGRLQKERLGAVENIRELESAAKLLAAEVKSKHALNPELAIKTNSKSR